MAYKYRSNQSPSKYARRSKRNFIITLLIIGALAYITITWILPTLIGGLGFLNSLIKPTSKVSTQEEATLAPPVLNIPYEATNKVVITIEGYAVPSSKVTIFVDEQEAGSTTTSEDGSFKVEEVSLNIGTNNIYGKTSDGRGESLPSKTIKVIFDDEKPLLEISEPEDGKEISGGDRKVNVSGKTDPSAQIFVNDIRVVVNSDGSFTTTYSLNDGENILTIKALDQASNDQEIVRRVIFQPS